MTPAVKILLTIAIMCAIALCITNIVKAVKYYKKYLIDIFEYNKGRGYFDTWHKSLHNCYTYTTWSVVFFCVAVLIYSFLYNG